MTWIVVFVCVCVCVLCCITSFSAILAFEMREKRDLSDALIEGKAYIQERPIDEAARLYASLLLIVNPSYLRITETVCI